MQSTLNKFALLVLLVSACACSTPPEGPLFTKAAPPTQSQSLIYFYRLDSPPYLYSPDIFMNDAKVLDLRNRGYSYVYAAPGRYKIRSVWSGDTLIDDQLLVLDARPGATYFVKQSSTTLYAGMHTKYDNILKSVSTSQGFYEIPLTRYIPPFVKVVNTTLAPNQHYPVATPAKKAAQD